MVIVLTGVAGAGKTTVGRKLADQLGWPFHDADDFHPPSNIELMRRGVALTDEHRTPWLEVLAAVLGEHIRAGWPLVLACSALTRAHRAVLLSQAPPAGDVRLVHLQLEAALLGERLARRSDHFFPASLLADQLAREEPPEAGTAVPVLKLDASRPVAELVAAIRAEFGV
jgi:gluconokinase